MSAGIEKFERVVESREAESIIKWGSIMARALQLAPECKDRLIKHGIVSVEGSDESSLREEIKDLFADMQQSEGEMDRASFLESEPYRNIVKLLTILGIIIPNLAGNWEVDRNEPERLGLKGYGEMEQEIAKKYPFHNGDPDPVRRHLEKGPGNGQAMEERRRLNHNLKSPFVQFEQYGIAREFFASVERVLARFVRPEVANDPVAKQFVKFLGFALRSELKRRWFDAEGSVISKWTRKAEVDFFDFNEIFNLLRDPSWIRKWLDLNTGTYKFSHEFENDDTAVLPAEVYGLFLNFLQCDENEVNNKVQTLENEQKSEKNRLLIKQGLRLKSVRKIVENDFSLDLTPLANRVSFILGAPFKFTGGRDGFLEKLNQAIDEIEQKNIKKSPKKLAKKQEGENDYFLKRFFNENFVSAVEHNVYFGSDPRDPNLILDLNEQPPVYLDGIFLDNFTNLDQHLPKESCSLITAVRSDSHEDAETFTEDIRQNLRQLKKGGCLVSDGVRESYTRLYRFKEVLAVLEEREFKDKFKAEIVFDTQTNMPVSLFIQREHENGYFSSEEKKNFMADGTFSTDLVSADSRVDLQLMQFVRSEILRITGDKESFFRLHKEIEDEVRAAITTMVGVELNRLEPTNEVRYVMKDELFGENASHFDLVDVDKLVQDKVVAGEYPDLDSHLVEMERRLAVFIEKHGK